MSFFSWPPRPTCFSSPCKPKGRRRLWIEPLESRHVLAAPFAEFVDPDPTIGDAFGFQILPLSTGNVVITAPFDDSGGNDAGAIYLFNGRTGALISTLTGASAGDRAGAYSVTALANGNFVVNIPDWDKDPDDPDVGAATWGSGVTGVSGKISAANSLIGSSSGDFSAASVVALTNGNYVVSTSGWDHDINNQDAGAVTWGDGTTGVRGPISSAVSLVGGVTNDLLGSRSVTEVGNGNFVVNSPFWSNGGLSNAGAVTFGNGETGITGSVSQSNSLVGSSAGDMVGSGFITKLTNGNYVVASPLWNDNVLGDLGAVTWGSGTSGVKGVIDSTNSLIGRRANDLMFADVTALTNGNYVVRSPGWDLVRPSDHHVFVDAGAVTFANGTTGITGSINSGNSLIGSTEGDAVGEGGVTALTNGNYVVKSDSWSNAGVARAGAATWGSGTTGVEGIVGSSNSLIGTHDGDGFGLTAVPLTNGNYVVSSPNWNSKAGAATWGDGTQGVTGDINANNSLVGTLSGTTDADQLGNGGITPLANGNYVVCSPLWNNGPLVDAGAVTWGDGTSGIHGAISAANSIVGDQASDEIGNIFFPGFQTVGFGVTPLANGNYVVASPDWNNGSATQAGAVTWGNGTAGSVHGVVGAANSLVGTTAFDGVGGVFGLPSGNYTVRTPSWDDPTGGGTVDVGAVTFGNGAAGTNGPISQANSLTGSTKSDDVGDDRLLVLATGNYVFGSDLWNNGAASKAGAVTFGSGVTGVVGAITSQNSALGIHNGGFRMSLVDDPFNHDFYAWFPGDGRVLVGSSIDGFAHPWHDASRPLDATNDAHIAPNDALAVINYINAFGPGAVPAGALLGKPFGFIDVDGNDFIAPNDALKIINQINAFGSSEGQGEGASDTAAIDAVLAASADQDLLTALSLDPFYGTSANSAKARRT